MSREKLTITYEPLRPPNDDEKLLDKVTALFNPSQVVLSHSASWRLERTVMDAMIAERRRLSLRSIEPATLALDLFFDAYEVNTGPLASVIAAGASILGLAAGARPAGDGVLIYTRTMAALTRNARELHRPPICTLKWGEWKLFVGVLSSLTTEFSLFLEDGTPVRATSRCTFTEYLSFTVTPQNEMNSPDVAKRYTVRPGDTLMNIAASFYGDASVWRLVAGANGIRNPRKLPAGLVLTLPALTAEER